MAEDASRQADPALRPAPRQPSGASLPGASLTGASLAGASSSPGEPVTLNPRPRRGRRSPVAAVPDAAPPDAPSGAVPATPDPDAEKAKVVHIVRRLQEEANQKRARKRPWVLISILAAIALPTVLVALYFIAFAADRYVSEARFALRSNDAQVTDVMGMITGAPASALTSDSYIIADYVHSREMVELLEERVGLRRVYSHPDADFLTRLDPETTLEGLIAYWKTRADVYYDSTKNTIAVEVEAFTAADAQRLTEEVVAAVRELVNGLSAQARRDAVQFAASEVARSELRVRGARADLLAFRTEYNEFDPTATATATLALTSSLEAERSQLNSQLAAVSGYLSAEAPSVQILKSRIAALGQEIDRVENQISQAGNGISADAGGTGLRDAEAVLAANPASGAAAGPDSGADSGPDSGARLSGSGALASVVGRYQEVQLDLQFAETAYAAAQASLERARLEVERVQSYLAIYVHPQMAEAAAYPRRFLNVLIVLVISAVLWAIGALAALTIRDHMP